MIAQVNLTEKTPGTVSLPNRKTTHTSGLRQGNSPQIRHVREPGGSTLAPKGAQAREQPIVMKSCVFLGRGLLANTLLIFL